MDWDTLLRGLSPSKHLNVKNDIHIGTGPCEPSLCNVTMTYPLKHIEIVDKKANMLLWS